jgi:phage baseplate assembly protein W
MAGAGLAPAGLFPAGFGTGDDAPVPPSGAWGSRYINPSTGDYEQDDSTRQLKQMPAVRQRFLLRLKTRRGSSSVRPNDGVMLPDKIDASFPKRVDDAVRTAMRQETDVEKVARIDAVTVARVAGNSGRVIVTVEFTDLTTGQADKVSF